MRQFAYSALAFCAAVSVAAAQTTSPAETSADTQAETTAADKDSARISEMVSDCRQMLHNVESQTKLAEMERPAIPRQDLRTIREAALAFARAGDDEGCEEVAEALQDLLHDRREEIEEALELAKVRDAVPVTQLPGSVMASTLVGSQVVNLQMEDLGTIEDLILTENEGRYALLKHGGFLGLGEDYTPVGLDRLRITKDRDYLVLDVSEEALDDAPEVNENDINDVSNWSQSVDQWWAANVDKGGQVKPQQEQQQQ